EREDPRAIVFWLNIRTVDFTTSRTSTDPLACKGTSMSRQKQLILGITHCFFEESTLVASLCLFLNTDDGDDDDAGDEDAGFFLPLVAFFHKLFTFLTSAY
ncbi:hypothetical protein C1645_740864, partial [Glomus cerebriforme]